MDWMEPPPDLLADSATRIDRAAGAGKRPDEKEGGEHCGAGLSDSFDPPTALIDASAWRYGVLQNTRDWTPRHSEGRACEEGSFDQECVIDPHKMITKEEACCVIGILYFYTTRISNDLKSDAGGALPEGTPMKWSPKEDRKLFALWICGASVLL